MSKVEGVSKVESVSKVKGLQTFPGNRIIWHALIVGVVWLLLLLLNNNIDPLYSSYLALIAMYATAMFGMTILVGLSGQVSQFIEVNAKT